LADDIEDRPWLIVPVLGVFVLLPILVLASATSTIRGRTWPWLWVAIVSGLIPLGTGCVCLSVVFAFW